MYDYRKDVKPDCIISDRTPKESGYLQVNLGGKVYYEHRLVYARHNKINLSDMQHKVVMHTCDCRQCINPDHLVLGSYTANARDASAKGRATGLSRPGEANPSASITWDTVRAIRLDRKTTGRTLGDIAKKFNISKSQVARIINNQSWKE